MNDWNHMVELREESGEIRAFRVSDGKEIAIPKPPREGVSLKEWVRWMGLDALEAFRQVALDRWTWETGSDDDATLVAYVEREIALRTNSVPGAGLTTLSLPTIRKVMPHLIAQEIIGVQPMGSIFDDSDKPE